MVTHDSEEDEFEEEFDEEEAEELKYIAGDTYYPYVGSFNKYKDDFTADITVDSDTSSYETHCDNISTTILQDNSFVGICQEVQKHLQYIMHKNDGNQYERCLYFNFFLNSETKYKTFHQHNGSKVFEAYKKLSNALNVCNLKIDYIREDILTELTDLYNIHESLDKFLALFDTSNQNICEQAKQFAELYAKNKKDCYVSHKPEFCRELENIQDSSYYSMKHKNCNEAVKILESVMDFNRTASVVVPCIIILSVSLFLYISYKFTPFGSWVNTKILKNKIWNNLSEESQLLNFRHEPLNLENNEYNIKYQAE
ncbi:PIR Superfamily Protein [Plasmodium ovale wallikeri]|uniref:PIR Superfamily Protein n=1 Tax=Plasmodium ovale wallikeri TaxID=864142 RepID=A0A1A9AN86_PLAOA|nr:PIR Superfamily Protein [Plasmodium ovale wallikeri]